MEQDIYTETTRKSYGQNIKNSFGGVILGVILFIASIFVLWLNEGHCAKQNSIANYITKNAIPTESTFIDATNNNKLIATYGDATTNATLTDGIISVQNALVLKRNVQMYQWREIKSKKTKTNLGGSTIEEVTYRYEKTWSERRIDSSKFHKTYYVNPPLPMESERHNADKGKFGEFLLTSRQTASFQNLQRYTRLPQNPNYTKSAGYYYKSKDINSPSIGDIRISYSYMPSGSQISVIGMQRPDKTITPMVTKNGNIYVQYDGVLSLNEMMEKFKKDNAFLTNMLRILGFILMLIGLNLIIAPILTILSFIPIFEQIMSFLTSGLIFLISLVLSLSIIALAWFFYRPVHAVCILVVIVLLTLQINNMLKGKII